jgi:hypothetical protein
MQSINYEGQQSMANSDKLQVLESILERAADELGDITPLVMADFYSLHPGSRELFGHHGGQNVGRMEADMVESALYCLMTWFDRPAEIEIMFTHTIPHHEMLNIPVEQFAGLLESTIRVLGATLATDDSSGACIWGELEDSLLKLAKNSSLSTLYVRAEPMAKG